VQGVLGGITVLLLLPKAVSIGHALLAQVFFLTTVLLVQITAPRWDGLLARSRRAVPSRALAWSLALRADYVPASWLAGTSSSDLSALIRRAFVGVSLMSDSIELRAPSAVCVSMSSPSNMKKATTPAVL